MMMYDFTIVTACRNRHNNLRRVINSWLQLNPSEIIIIDWGSLQPVSEIMGDYSKGKINFRCIRVDNANSWVLTHAFNIGLSLVSTNFLLKLDCEHECKPELFKDINFQKNTMTRFSAIEKNEQSAYINGAFFSCTVLLRNLGFFDERLLCYGWDDTDLYLRAAEIATTYVVKTSHITHIPQESKTRTSDQTLYFLDHLFADRLNYPLSIYLTIKNRHYLSSLPPWNTIENEFVFPCSDKVLGDFSLIKQTKFIRDDKDEFLAHVSAVAHVISIKSGLTCNKESAIQFIRKELIIQLKALAREYSSLQWLCFNLALDFYLPSRSSAKIHSSDMARLFKYSSLSPKIRAQRERFLMLVKHLISAS